MYRTTLIHSRERMFIRSCLESAPVRAVSRPFSPVNQSGARRAACTPLHQLKHRSLHAALEQITDPALCKEFCRAANVAAEAAWETSCLLLIFPCLFEELIENVRARYQREQLPASHGESSPPGSTTDHVLDDVYPDSWPANPISRAKSAAALFT